MNKFIKTVTLAVLALATSLAFAISSPKEIEADLANHNYSQARAKVEAVIAEKPTSARAHLLRAFLLVHVDNDAVGATSELKLVQQYDKTGDTTSSPLFNRVQGEIKSIMHPVAVQHKELSQPVAMPVAEESSFNFFYFFVGAVVLGFIVMGYMIFKSTQSPKPIAAVPAYTEDRFSSNYSKPTSPSVAGVSPSKPWREERERVVYRDNPVIVPAYQPPVQSQGMGMMGTAASVAGGVLAGELLHDMLTDKPEKKKRNTESTSSENTSPQDNSYLFSTSREESSYPRSTPSYTEDEPSTRSSGSSSSSWGSDSSSSYSSSSSDSYSSSSDSSSSSSDW